MRYFVSFFLIAVISLSAEIEFSPIMNISNTSGWVSKEPAIVHENDTIYLTWNKWGDIAFRKSENWGETWSASQILYSAFDYGGNYPVIAASENHVYVVYWRNTSGNSQLFLSRSTNGGNTFSSEMQISSAIRGAITPQIVAHENSVYVLYEDRDADWKYQIYLIKSEDYGVTWSEAVQISNPLQHSRWCGLTYENNTLYAAWNAQVGSNYDDTDLFFAKSEDEGTTWTNPQNLSNAGNYISRLHLTAFDGTIIISVQERADGIQSDILLYRSNDDGVNWLPIENISNNSGNSSRPDIALLGEGENQRIYVTWADETYAADSQIYFRYSIDDGVNWTEQMLISQTTGEALWPIITGKQSNESDEIYVVWYHANAGTFDYEIYGRSGVNNVETVGQIQGFVYCIETGEPIDDVILSIGNYTVSTDDTGFYQLNLPAGEYELSCSAPFYETYFDSDVEIVTGETLTYPIELTPAQPVLFPPLSFQGELVNETIYFNWEAPQSNGWYIQWDNGENDSSVGGTNIPVFDVAIRFTVEDLADFNEHYLSKVRAYFAETDCTIRLRIWSGGNESYAGNLIYEEWWEEITVGWNEKVLPQPLMIDNSQELWIGYRVENPNGVYPAGTDSGAAVPFKGDMLLYGSNWVSMSSYFGWDVNWNIQGFVVPFEENLRQDKYELLGYNFYENDVLQVENITATELSWYNPNLRTEYYVTAVYDVGESVPSNSVFIEINETPTVEITNQAKLYGNHPNPFNPETSFRFYLPQNSFIKMEIFNLKGQLVQTLAEDIFSAGEHKLIWNGLDESGKQISSGVYLYRLVADNEIVSTQKCLLLK